MAIILKSDTYKLNIDKKMAIGIMTLVGFIILALIIANIYWINKYDTTAIAEKVIASGEKPTYQNMDAYVRFRAIFSILGNTLVFAVFMALVWMSISKKRLGLAFGLFWMCIFITNAISTPFYSIQIDGFAIAIAILNGIIGIVILFWFASLVAYRQRLRQEIARKRGI